jgi:DnaJ-class molecular chaperone
MEIKLYGQVVEFEKNCDICDGIGETFHSSMYGVEMKQCQNCNGTGSVPSENGQVILDFVRKYMSPADKEQD